MLTLSEVTAAFGVMISCFLAFVAWQQYWTARVKLNLDLFEKRFKVFQDTMALFVPTNNGNWSFSDVLELNRQIDIASCLFPDPVTLKMKEMGKYAWQMDEAKSADSNTKNFRAAHDALSDNVILLRKLFVQHIRVFDFNRPVM